MTGFDRPLFGICLWLVSGLLMAGMFVCVKAASDQVPLGQIVFSRSFFAIFPLIVFLWIRGEFPDGLKTGRPAGHIVRSGFGALSLFAAFAAVGRLNLAEAVLISQLSPMIMAIAAVGLLSERLSIYRIGGLALGFSGVLVLVWPELGTPGDARLAGIVLGLVSAVLSALALIMVRDLNRTESPGAIALYFVIASMLGSVVTLPWGWVMPDAPTLALLVASGLFGGLGHIAMTMAFRYAEASRLAPFEYVALLWPLLADLVIFRATLSDGFMIAAAFVIAGSAVAATERKRS